MSKGLSELQRYILKIAYRNRGGSYKFGYIRNYEILMGFYNFPAHPPKPSHVTGTPQIFNRQEIGINRYKAASVSVVKAFSRLVERGLATRKYNFGIILTVEGVKTALDVKGCALFLINRKTDELEVAASYGLSDEYLNKGPLSALKSIAQSLDEGPVAIYDVSDDPRIQYPEAAQKEGIVSIMAVPITISGKLIGALRVYTSEAWEVTLEDVSFVQALAQLAGMAIEMSRLYQGQKEAIGILKQMREAQSIRSKKMTPYEGVPVSAPLKKRSRRAA